MKNNQFYAKGKEGNFIEFIKANVFEIKSVNSNKDRFGQTRFHSKPYDNSRDPVQLNFVFQELIKRNKWQGSLIFERIKLNWKTIVGRENAIHTEVFKLSDEILYVQATSTAWATQLRFMQKEIINNISKFIGSEVVGEIRILGPKQPNWYKGPRYIPGRGPRDTYG